MQVCPECGRLYEYEDGDECIYCDEYLVEADVCEFCDSYYHKEPHAEQNICPDCIAIVEKHMKALQDEMGLMNYQLENIIGAYGEAKGWW